MRPKGGVLAVCQGNHGDVLAAGAALRSLAASEKPLSLLCGPDGAGSARLLPDVKDLLVYPAPWIGPDASPVRADVCRLLIEAVACRQPKEAVIFTFRGQSPLPIALLLRLAGVARIAAISAEHPGSLLDVRHRVSDGIDDVDRALSLATAAGFPPPLGEKIVLPPRPTEAPRLVAAG